MGKTVILLRHGETVENRMKVIQGDTPGCLTQVGRMQARAAGGKIRGIAVDRVICSDLERARQTLEEILPVPGALIEYSMDLRERGFGVFNRRLISEYIEWQNRTGVSPLLCRPDGGESHADVRRRAEKVLGKLGCSDAHETVLLITHGGVISHVLSLIYGDTLERLDAYPIVENGSLTSAVLHPDGTATNITVNDTSHLPKGPPGSREPMKAF